MSDHQINVSCVLSEHGYSELSTTFQDLVTTARQARSKAYAPYSDFAVGAAVRLKSGETVSGSNQENAAYPSGLCAERTALFYAMHEHPNAEVEALAVTVDERSKHLPFPCGSCLQVIAEYETRQENPIQILLIHPHEDRVWQANGVKNLLPFAFGKDNLLR